MRLEVEKCENDCCQTCKDFKAEQMTCFFLGGSTKPSGWCKWYVPIVNKKKEED